ncbi:uncharacterized protein LOC133314310 [Gastrolobium bilobum]|uniref:uncharacterized protein LOC133314310 n=1 Tax=Gastrolobium bilobum TaxID=150636 RepID=UPI002AB3206D|nr:uncharacterized protein LOC133314310 [Gastrolobium bilobum]
MCTWNCRGAGKKGFSYLIKDLVYQNKIQVLVLLETRLSGKRTDKVIRNLGFDNYFRRESVGFSGRIWIIWNKSESLEDERRLLWDRLKNIETNGVDEWAVMGFSGPKFTWKRGSLEERIHRLVVNQAWHLNSPNKFLSHLNFNGSDHRPLLLSGEAQFLAPEEQLHVGTTGDKFHREASLWHHDKFRALHRKKKQTQGRIRGVDAQLCRGLDNALERLHNSFWQDLNTIYIEEELTWFQRSRCK